VVFGCCTDAIDAALQRRYSNSTRSQFQKPGKIPMQIVRFVCCLALLFGVVSYRIDAASAQGSPDAQQACTPDAMRLCADVIPDVAKVTKCMSAKYSQLSAPCRQAMAGTSHGKHHRKARRCRHHCG
jgi:hypothetical protein